MVTARTCQSNVTNCPEFFGQLAGTYGKSSVLGLAVQIRISSDGSARTTGPRSRRLKDRGQ